MRIQNINEQQLDAAGIKLVNSTDLYPALHTAGDAGLPMLVVDNALSRTIVALQGAHLMSFRPAGKRDMFWVSPKCVLEAGKPIRGGIPLCLPWFGPGLDPQVMHGFSRLMEWTPVAAEKQADGASRLVLELSGDASVNRAWPHEFTFRLEVIAGSELKLVLTAENRSNAPAPIAFAYHSYFAVPAVAEAKVAGLEGVTFIDKTDNATKKRQEGEVTISALTDRVYLDVPRKQTVKTSVGNIEIESPAKCAVVWNAWTNDKNMADLGEGNHVGYICVERGDVADHAVTLAPGGKYQCPMTLSL